MYVGPADIQIVGTGDMEVLTGDAGADALYVLTGNDVLAGGAGTITDSFFLFQ